MFFQPVGETKGKIKLIPKTKKKKNRKNESREKEGQGEGSQKFRKWADLDARVQSRKEQHKVPWAGQGAAMG